VNALTYVFIGAVTAFVFALGWAVGHALGAIFIGKPPR